MTTNQAVAHRSFLTFPSDTPLDIGVDMDGVGFHFVESLAVFASEYLNRPLSSFPPASSWEFYQDDWGLTLDQFLEVGNAAANAGHLFTYGGPLPGFKEGIDALLAAGHRIHIVTDRAGFGDDGVAVTQTQEWLQREGIAYTTLHVTADKASVPADVFVEDRPKYYEILEAAGVDVFLIDWPYNSHVACPANRRIPDFTSFVTAVLQGGN